MLTLYQIRRAWGIPNISPYCTKLETYLRMADIPYQVADDDLPFRRAPHAKVPFVAFEGRLIADSSVIIEELKQRLGDTVDVHLTQEQRALGHLVQRTLEEGTYWGAVLYVRWYDAANFERVRRDYFEGTMGPLLRWVVPDLIRKRVLSALHGQGISRHDRRWIFALVQRDFESVAHVLGDKPYLLSDKPSSYDAVLYAFSSAIWLTPFAKDLPPAPENVAAHMRRMHERYFPELRAGS
jgi:glutathione S-transferase